MPQPTRARDLEVMLIVGAAGEEQYGKLFDAQVTAWKEACTKASVQVSVIGQDGGEDDLKKLESGLKKAVSTQEGQLWLVMIGHGTFDGREAKFNLRGPDLTARQLGEWLKPILREVVFIQTASAGAGFIPPVSGKNRVIVSATKGADEIYYTRFGEYFAPAIGGLPEADLDQDRQVSLLEAFLYASKMTAEFYEKEGRLATEHALLEDNGDGTGTRAEVFEGVKAKDTKADGARAGQIALVLSEEETKLTDEQRQKRDALERELDVLKGKRGEFGEDLYYTELEKLLRSLAEVYGGAS
ncbi:hypothetical protein EI77_02383 [Prosthecobacter fusiformis]|uniref:Caspase domain-containing protein n=2 Tax=Prosthecobacter fusiformis TaxID=48464 RepID=A0A4R7RZG6_9BACT|nr:hypothetical protein EI77_02383 [Prosthecobacter fusiformis]